MIWTLKGTAAQNALVEQALAACDFPFDLLAASLGAEGRTTIDVTWQDLSRYAHVEGQAHDHADGAHTITREVDGRSRVLGLFYLPPHTAVVLDTSLQAHPSLAQEVFLAEAAHAVDYHWMTDPMRLAVWNALHDDDAHDLPEGHVIPESGDQHHGHSWFDGPAGYASWVGEAFMAAFVDAFAPSVPVTMTLDHHPSPDDAQTIRAALLPPQDAPGDGDPVPMPPEEEQALREALKRFLGTKSCPAYLRAAAQGWLA